jgi:EmrB/QacA subfamily drug resistance transporter
MTVAQGMLTIDVTVVRVALPSIQRELDTSYVAQQWVVNAYLLALAVFVIAGGRAGDMFGRRRVFLVGTALFTVCSALCGVASGSAELIAARAGQGLGAAIMMPGTASIVTDAFAGRGLGRALGTLGGISAAGLSLGPVLGGALVQLAGWRWIFFLNVPVAVAVFALTLRAVPESRDAGARRVDPAGLLALGGSLTALTLALMQGPGWGWGSPATLGLLAAAVGLGAALVAIESRSPDPLLDLGLLRRPVLAAANALGACAQFVVTGLTVLLAIFLQTGLGYGPLDAGLLLLPLTIPLAFVSPLGGRLTDRLGPRWPTTAGMALITAALVEIGLLAAGGSYLAVLPGLVLFACGFGLVLTSVTSTAMAGGPGAERGVVSGIYNTARNVGASLGVAVMGSLLAVLEQRRLDEAFARTPYTEPQRSEIEGLLAGAPSAQAALHDFPPAVVREIQATVHHAFSAAFANTMLLSAAIGALGVVLAATALRGAGTGGAGD